MTTGITGTSKTTSAEGFGPISLTIEFKRKKSFRDEGVLSVEPNQMRDFFIVSDMNRMLPSFRLRLLDSEGFLSCLLPFDHSLSKMFVSLGRATDAKMDSTVEYGFDVYRRFPSSGLIYDTEGLLQVDELFSPPKIRGFSGTVKSTLETIAEELGVDNTEISVSLNYKKKIVQPGWSNGRLLNYLKGNLIGKNDEAGFFCFIKNVGLKTVFVFKSLKDFTRSGSKYKFCIGSEPFESEGEIYFPIIGYRAFDNYKLLGAAGCRKRGFAYFDYDDSEYVNDSLELQGNEDSTDDYYSLTEFFMIDKDDEREDNITLFGLGRGNEFNPDFKGKVLGSFHKDVTSLSKIWIDTWGIEDIYPGDLVEIQSLEHTIPEDKIGYQYQGYWLVERVVQMIGNALLTRLLLTRGGMSAATKQNLLEAENWKR